MMNSEQAIEKELQAKGLEAPRLNPAHIDAMIVGEQYHVFAPSMKTVCELTLRNGFTVTGFAGVVSKSNFDPEIGKAVARKNAREQVWQLEGYLLTENLFQDKLHDAIKAQQAPE